MGRFFVVVLAIMVFLSFTASAHAQADDLLDGMRKKLERGVVNTLTAGVEFPNKIIKGFKYGVDGEGNNKLLGGFVGICDGFKHTLGRFASGVTDVAGFWAANPANNEGIGIPLDAEYAWEDGEAYNLFDPSFGEATLAPVQNKFMRGAGNLLLCFLEFPGQVIKGSKEDDFGGGIVKGVWYTLSRAWHGASEMVTPCLPWPKDQMGVAFDQRYPWDAFHAADFSK